MASPNERGRLFSGARRRVEFERTQEILRRVLPAPPARVLDVGGGAHAAWLAADGYTVDLVDPIPWHVQQSEQAAARTAQPFSARLGDARRLPASDRSADVVLLLGPLYHLDGDGRRQALTEAIRVLRHDGVLVAAAISRFASLLDGLRMGWLADETFAAIVERDLATGRHHNPDPVGGPSGSRPRGCTGPTSYSASSSTQAWPSRRSSPSKDRCGCSTTWMNAGRTTTNAVASCVRSGRWNTRPPCSGSAPTCW